MKKIIRLISILLITTLFAVSATVVSSAIKSPQLTKTSVTLKVGDTYQLYVNYATSSISWSSNNSKVADVKNGEITAKEAGIATITVKHGSTNLKCSVKVKDTVKADTSGAVSVITYKDHTYALYEDVYTWEKAKKLCEKKGGYLAVITSKKEQAVIEKLLLDGKQGGYWLGGKRNKNNTFSWITNEKFDYSNWASWAPDDYKGNQDFIMVYRANRGNDGKWDDNANTSTYIDYVGDLGFICEWDY